MKKKPTVKKLKGIEKCPTGINGLDEITGGGLPRGRPTLVCGSAGCGKTLLAMEFIVRGARDLGEPGVFMAFEETEAELTANVASLGFDLPLLIRQKKFAIDYVHIERGEIEEAGEYDLEGLFVRLNSMIEKVGARRVAIDSLEALFAGLPNEGILRSELRRLFRWLKDKGVTVVITGEQGEKMLTRHGLEEYISDCVIFMDHRVTNQVSTRRLRIVKYRGSRHGTNEYPALIDEHGLSVLPISSLGLAYPVSNVRIPTGIARLDTMLGGKGYFRGSSILISGTAGSGKSSIAAAFVDSVCKKSGRALYWSSEESPAQITRNMTSIGFDLDKHVRKGLLQFYSVRPTIHGLENHLVNLHKMVSDFKPEVLIMDPITNLLSIGNDGEIKLMLTRVIDFLKNEGVTAMFTSLTENGGPIEQSELGVCSLMDTWLLLSMVQSASERNRLLYVLKSRGMSHSNQMREFLLTDKGIDLVDVYEGGGTVYTGTERLNQEARERATALVSKEAAERRQRELSEERLSLEAQNKVLQAKLANIAVETGIVGKEETLRLEKTKSDRDRMGLARG
jgi:circadian clock protein KaiC